jgi:hypothetical protein
MEERDKVLVGLVIAVIGVSVFTMLFVLFSIGGGSGSWLTGKVTVADTGTATTTLAGSAGVGLAVNSIDFGSGYYNASCTQGYAELDSWHHDSQCWINTTAFPTTAQAHKIRNTGGGIINVTGDSDKTDAEAFFCGSTGGCLATNIARVKYHSMDELGETGACNAGNLSGWNNVLTYDTEPSSTFAVCSSLNFQDDKDEEAVVYMFHVPADATSGEKTITITYTAVIV